MCPGHEPPAAFGELDVSDPDVPNLVAALGGGPGQPRGGVLVDLGRDVVDEEGKPHADTSPSYRSMTDTPARSLSRRCWAPGTSSQRGRTHGCLEYVAVEQVLDQRDVVQCELADEQDVEAAAFGEGFEDAGDPPKVDRVLHRTAPDDDPDGDGPGGPRRHPMIGPQRFEDLQESGAVQHLVDRHHPRREHPETPWVQSAAQVFGEHGKALLGLVVARQTDPQQGQWLPGAVLVGDDMGADLVMQQRLDPVRPERGGLGDEQPAERHHQVGDVVAYLDVNRELWIQGAVSIELRTRRLRERPGGDAPAAGGSGRDGLEQLIRGGRERLRDPSVKLQRPVHEP